MKVRDNSWPKTLGDLPQSNDDYEISHWIADAYVAGKSLRWIAEKVGISHMTVRNIAKRELGDLWNTVSAEHNIHAKQKWKDAVRKARQKSLCPTCGGTGRQTNDQS